MFRRSMQRAEAPIPAREGIQRFLSRIMDSMLRRTCLILFLLTGIVWAGPPLLVIAIDGYRWDYAERGDSPNILKLKREGAAAEALIPAFPSSTFPNFHSMATGLLPEHHGIVAMSFYDAELARSFHYNKNGSDGTWYEGNPIWLLAQSEGKKSATFFWPGSDAEIHGGRPTYWKQYDAKVTHQERVAQVLEWMRMPEGQRPDLTIVYFADVDHAGHVDGPDSPQLHAAVAAVDATVGELVRGSREIRPDVNIVLLSDHGMAATQKYVDLAMPSGFAGCRAENNGHMSLLYCDSEKLRDQLQAKLQSESSDVKIFRRDEVPSHLHYRDNRRIGDLVVLPKGAYQTGVVASDAAPRREGMRNKGVHGLDPEQFPEMRGILIGSGPAFRSGAVTAPARNIDVFYLFCAVLGIKAPDGLDGNFRRVQPLLK